jgi:dUTP pyrophosphatase
MQPTYSSGEEKAIRELGHEPFPPVPFMVSGPLVAPPYTGDCGLDLVTAKDTVLGRSCWRDIPCGVSVAMPPGTFGWICGRSSTWVKWGIFVVPGVIDEGWRGELFTMAYRPALASGSLSDITIPAGTRLAQLIVLPNLMRQLRLVQVEQLPESERGRRGFGSSGT